MHEKDIHLLPSSNETVCVLELHQHPLDGNVGMFVKLYQKVHPEQSRAESPVCFKFAIHNERAACAFLKQLDPEVYSVHSIPPIGCVLPNRRNDIRINELRIYRHADASVPCALENNACFILVRDRDNHTQAENVFFSRNQEECKRYLKPVDNISEEVTPGGLLLLLPKNHETVFRVYVAQLSAEKDYVTVLNTTNSEHQVIVLDQLQGAYSAFVPIAYEQSVLLPIIPDVRKFVDPAIVRDAHKHRMIATETLKEERNQIELCAAANDGKRQQPEDDEDETMTDNKRQRLSVQTPRLMDEDDEDDEEQEERNNEEEDDDSSEDDCAGVKE